MKFSYVTALSWGIYVANVWSKKCVKKNMPIMSYFAFMLFSRCRRPLKACEPNKLCSFKNKPTYGVLFARFWMIRSSYGFQSEHKADHRTWREPIGALSSSDKNQYFDPVLWSIFRRWADSRPYYMLRRIIFYIRFSFNTPVFVLFILKHNIHLLNVLACFV